MTLQNNRDKKNGNRNNNSGDNYRPIMFYIIAAILFTLVINSALTGITNMTTVRITYDEFLGMVSNGEVESVTFDTDRILITPVTKEIESEPQYKKMFITGYITNAELLPLLEEAGVSFESKITDRSSSFIYNWVLPLIFFYAIMTFVLRSAQKRGGAFGVGRSNAKIYVEKETGVRFSDVAGQEEAKETLKEIIDFLNNPERYGQIGARLPKGALLVGPPGTGKTLLAKAVAGEADVPFFSLSGSDFVEMFVGVGASRVRELFKDAVKHAPSIIFIDEIDAIGKNRDSVYGGGNDEREQTLNQLLSEMDGFDSKKAVVILAATNRPEVLDKALLRPGRFDRRVIVDKPDLPGREAILKVHCKAIKMDEEIKLREIALATSGAVGADLANMVNEAALGAVRAGRSKVSQKDLLEAVELVIAGKEKKDRVLSEKEKRLVAFHEVGHALAAALQKHSQPVHKITIVPRTMGALGYTMQLPEEEKFLMSKDEMLTEITTLLAGRAAEELEFQTATTGASNDIDRATKTARAMVVRYGMSERFGMVTLETETGKYLETRGRLECADSTAAAIDEEIMRIIAERYEDAKSLLNDNMGALRRISEFLIEKESISGEEFMEKLNKEKNISETDN